VENGKLFKQLEKINELKIGQIVSHKGTNTSYVVTDIFEGRAVAVRSIEITNPIEWNVVKCCGEKITENGWRNDSQTKNLIKIAKYVDSIYD
jgi:hypothetical protein